MKIKTIEITNIKGIKHETFALDIEPNKPNLLVAQNGFGKSSFGIAFESIKRDKITLDKKHLHERKTANKPEIKIAVQTSKGTKNLIANDSSNTINDTFDIVVINSQIKAKARMLRIQGRNIASPYLEIEPITLINTIPQKVSFEYKVSDLKKEFGSNGKILSDISELLCCSVVLQMLDSKISWPKLTGKKITKSINETVEAINAFAGKTEEIKVKAEAEIDKIFGTYDELDNFISNLTSIDSEFLKTRTDCFLAIFQLLSLKDKLGEDFKKAIKYNTYLIEKAEFIQIIEIVNSTRFKIKPREDKKKGLIIEWPQGHEISNGERDVLSLIILLIKARRTFKKNNCILVIDEIFDYLDDANLVAFQYFITDFIEKMSQDGRNIFPILMTHLDPLVFNQFCFNKHKIKVHYLQSVANKTSPNLLNIIYNREDLQIKENISKHFFHFHPDDIDLDSDFARLGLNPDWSVASKFHKRNFRELRKYLIENRKYDPVAVCIALRLKIEKLVYDSIFDPSIKTIMLETKKTRNKLEECVRRGVSIPETYFLLGIIYNSSLHLKSGQDISRPLSTKLENGTIKKIITDIFKNNPEF